MSDGKLKTAPDAGENAAQASEKRSGFPAWIYALAILVVASIVGFAVFNGSSLQKASIAGLFDFEMAPKPLASQAVFSQKFIYGKWQVEQNTGQFSGDTILVYHPDGTVDGWAMSFMANNGQRESWHGTWKATKVSDSEFNLDASINGKPFHAPFRIFDQDHIQNENDNYIAVRLP